MFMITLGQSRKKPLLVKGLLQNWNKWTFNKRQNCPFVQKKSLYFHQNKTVLFALFLFSCNCLAINIGVLSKWPPLSLLFCTQAFIIFYKAITILSAKVLFPRKCSFFPHSLYDSTFQKIRHCCDFHRENNYLSFLLKHCWLFLGSSGPIFPNDTILYSSDICQRHWREKRGIDRLLQKDFELDGQWWAKSGA